MIHLPSLFIIKIQRKYISDILFKPKEWSRTAARGEFVYMTVENKASYRIFALSFQ